MLGKGAIVLIKVQDERKQPFHVVDKLVTWFWLPFIGHTGYTLYNLYISLINYETHAAFPSIRRVADFLGVSENTVRKYNRLLKEYGLLRIEDRTNEENGASLSHTYFILAPPALPEHLQAEYKRRRLVRSSLMEVRALELEAQSRLAAEEGGPVAAELIDIATLPPLQSLQGGLQSLQGGLQPVKRGVQSVHRPPAISAGPSLRTKKTKRTTDNNSASATAGVVVPGLEELKQALREFGVHARAAAKLAETEEREKILAACETLAYLIDQGRGPRDNAAWLVAALTQGYDLQRTAQRETESAAEAKQRVAAEKEVQAETQKARQDFASRRQAQLQELGISPELQELWAAAMEELRRRKQWSPMLQLAFLEKLEGEAATIRVEAEIAREILEKPERHQALREALEKVTGRTVYLTLSGDRG